MPSNSALMPKMDASRKGAKVRRDSTLAQAFLDALRTYGASRKVASDAASGALSYADLVSRSFVFSRLLDRSLDFEEKNVGLMLPTSSAMMTAFFGVQFTKRAATMINFTAGVAVIVGACRAAALKSIVTSRAFIERLNLTLVLEALEDADVQVLYLEDLKERASFGDKLAGLGASLAARLGLLRAPKADPNEAAVILFTSGSEGTPKGVALSHKNILANVWQFTEVLDVGAWDKMFACLPLYHSFGLTVGALLPIMTGMPTFFYPSPLHYHDVPKAIRATRSTLLLTTDTFLTGYARSGEAEDFASLRYIVAGAEKLKEQTRAIWEGRFGKVIFEGYGVTETAPVISVNTQDNYQLGSVGKLLPEIEADLRPVEGITCGAELWVRGPNVMLGTMTADAPGVIKPPKDGWHNTGDVVSLDGGFLSIKGRIKRFAKSGGEMISLVAVEQAISQLYPGVVHAVVSVPHARRGESVILLTEQEKVDADALRHHIRKQGLSEFSVPREILSVPKVPVLGSGKIDYITARVRAMEELLGSKDVRQKSA